MGNAAKDNDDKICYKLLCEVFLNGSYSMIALGASDLSPAGRAYITRLVYGTIEKSVQFDYIIKKLCDKLPQKSVAVMLKMGLYMLRCMAMPDYAAVNRIVDLAKAVGKSGVSGFINAVLRKSTEIIVPRDNLSAHLSYPQWVVNKLLKRYDKDFIVATLERTGEPMRHIRRNANKISEGEFEKKLYSEAQYFGSQIRASVQRGEENGKGFVQNIRPDDTFYEAVLNTVSTNPVRSNVVKPDITQLNAVQSNSVRPDEGEKRGVQKTALGYLADGSAIAALGADEFTFQSLASMLAVKAYLSGEEFESVLDVCSAPGGKAIYLKELRPKAKVTCCDVLPHRVELIKKYAVRMGAKLEYACEDATCIIPQWLNRFDLVICDVPCSGLGIKTKPDILLNKRESNITELAKLQYDILNGAANYVKAGGVLCYSTCTVFREENEDVAERFLALNRGFELCPIRDEDIEENEGMVNLYPTKYGSDFFFIARFRKVE
ncbi:MAG: methyltransferase domain-containing protein [Firmicutes bacterium]|nr:methyltransferase domain-containing protein [Bacillota bacterium]